MSTPRVARPAREGDRDDGIGFAAREATALSEYTVDGELHQLRVDLHAPGEHVGRWPSVTLAITHERTARPQPGDESKDDEERFEVHVHELDRLVAVLAHAIDIARRSGALDDPSTWTQNRPLVLPEAR